MEDYNLLIEKAYKEAKMADYMLGITSRLIKDKKILISVINHVNKSFIFAIKSFLIRERMFRRIAPVPTDEQLLLDIFFSTYHKKLNIDPSISELVKKINKAVNAYNERGMLLQRSNKYVFISSNYNLIDFKMNDIKSIVNKTINFVNEIKLRLKE